MVRGDPQPPGSPTGSGDSAGCGRRIDFEAKIRIAARRNRTPAKGVPSARVHTFESRFSKHNRFRRRIRFRCGGFGCGIYETQIRRAISWMVVVSTVAHGRIGTVFMMTAQHDVLHVTLRALLGVGDDQALPFLDAKRGLNSGHSAAIIADSPSSRDCGDMSREGYTHQRRFALLPSRRNLRWLLPHTGKRRGIDGLQLYMPHGHVGRIVKALVVHARATGWQGWVRDSVVVASRQSLPIEDLLTEATGEAELVLSLSPGTPGTFQKLTVQVMRSNGSILGYLKMPMTESADERLRHEAAVVRDLDSYQELRPHIPRLIFAGLLQGRYVILQSPLEGKGGPLRYASLHERFLERLHSCRSERRPGLRIVEETGRKWNRVAVGMGTKWQELGRKALGVAARELGGKEVVCGIAHGDFAPWNMRIDDGNLRLFDWESASYHAPLLWDQFHFMTQTECLLKVRHERGKLADGRKKNRSLYLLYLLDTLARYWTESAQDAVIRYREEQLMRYISIDDQAA